MIAAVCWVPKGAAKNVPVVAEPPTEEQLRELLQQHEDVREASEGEGDDEDEELDADEMEDAGAGFGGSAAVATALAAASALGATASQSNGHKSHEEMLADGLAELDMDHYDEEDEGVEIFGNGGLGAAYYPSNEDDPYLVDKNDDEEEEIEDMTIKDSDLIILTARNEDDVSHLEFWVYETEENVSEDPDEEMNMYVHHDIMLPAFPLCLTWLDCNPKGEGKGNYVAVGTMQPEIEIWDLDVVDSVEPVSVLGGAIQPVSEQGSTKKKSKKKSKKKAAAKQVQYKEGSHTDAVLGLSWNSVFRNVIASASADKSVKIWDVVKGACEHTMNIHTDKVQAVAWNLKEPTVLLSGSFDRTVALTDMRAPQAPAIRWSVSADVEYLAWDPHTPHTFTVSLEDGTVGGYDVRTGTTDPQQGKALFTIHAHDKAACCLAYNTAAPNLLATVSTDKMVKLWDLTDNQPTCIASTNPKVGAVFAASFCKDAPFLLAVGGSKGNLHVWDTLAIGEVSRRFGKFSPRPRRASNNVEA